MNPSSHPSNVSLSFSTSSSSSSSSSSSIDDDGLVHLLILQEKIEETEKMISVITKSSQIRSYQLENLREITLSLATLERSISEYVYLLLKSSPSQSVATISQKDTLRSLIHHLQALPINQRWKLFPAGGTVSMIYCFIHVLTKLTDSLRYQLLMPTTMTPSLVSSHFGRLITLTSIVIGYWQYQNIVKHTQVLSIRRFPNIISRNPFMRFLKILFRKFLVPSRYVILVPFLLLLYRILHGVYVYRSIQSLDKLHHQLLILLRMWYLMNTLYSLPSASVSSSFSRSLSLSDEASIPSDEPLPSSFTTLHPRLSLRNIRSYTVLTEDTPLSTMEKTISRRLLENVALPRASALWPSQHWKFHLLKRLLDLFYASKYKSWTVRRYLGSFLPSLPAPLPGLPTGPGTFLTQWTDNYVTFLSFFYYALFRPLSVSEDITASIMLHPSLDFITECWRFQDQPVNRWITHNLFVPCLPFHTKRAPLSIRSIPCRIFCNISIDKEVFNDIGVQPFDSPGTVLLPPVLLLIHGGGFVGKSYTSDIPLWTNFLASLSPSVSPLLLVYVDYSLAPEHHYPQALNELYAVYEWLSHRSSRIIIHGESAGGNLGMALIIQCIQRRALLPRLPCSLSLAYPSLNLNLYASPSRGLHMSDPLIPYHLIIQLAAAYVRSPGDHDAFIMENTLANPLIHPAYVSDAILRQFPPLRISVGGLDPLLDDSIDLISRLRRLHPSLASTSSSSSSVSSMIEYDIIRHLPHGYFNFRFLPGANEAIERTQRWIIRQVTDNSLDRGMQGREEQ